MKLLHALLNNIHDGILLTDADLVIQYVNPAFTRLLGYGARDVLGLTPACLQSGRHAKPFYDAMRAQLARSTGVTTQGHWHGEIWNRHKNGELLPLWLSIQTIEGTAAHAAKYLATYSLLPPDIGVNPWMQVFQRCAADPLTGLATHSLFLDRLHYVWALSKRQGNGFAVIHLALGGLDAVVELLGPAVGDAVLAEAAERMHNRIREIDTLARYQHGEFWLMLTQVKERKDVEFMANNILAWLQMPYSVAGGVATVSARLGVAMFPDDWLPTAQSPAELLPLASAALQRAQRTSHPATSVTRNADVPRAMSVCFYGDSDAED